MEGLSAASMWQHASPVATEIVSLEAREGPTRKQMRGTVPHHVPHPSKPSHEDETPGMATKTRSQLYEHEQRIQRQKTHQQRAHKY